MKLKLSLVLIISVMLNGCTTEEVQAESPCPPQIFSFSLSVVDSITELDITNAIVNVDLTSQEISKEYSLEFDVSTILMNIQLNLMTAS